LTELSQELVVNNMILTHYHTRDIIHAMQLEPGHCNQAIGIEARVALNFYKCSKKPDTFNLIQWKIGK
jgi:hypothetical protein